MVQRAAHPRRHGGTQAGLQAADLAPRQPLRVQAGAALQLVAEAQALHLGVETPFAPARKAHPAFAVDDLERCRERLGAAGVETVPDTTSEHVRRFYAADPFGNRLEFVQAGDRF